MANFNVRIRGHTDITKTLKQVYLPKANHLVIIADNNGTEEVISADLNTIFNGVYANPGGQRTTLLGVAGRTPGESRTDGIEFFEAVVNGYDTTEAISRLHQIPMTATYPYWLLTAPGESETVYAGSLPATPSWIKTTYTFYEKRQAENKAIMKLNDEMGKILLQAVKFSHLSTDILDDAATILKGVHRAVYELAHDPLADPLDVKKFVEKLLEYPTDIDNEMEFCQAVHALSTIVSDKAHAWVTPQKAHTKLDAMHNHGNLPADYDPTDTSWLTMNRDGIVTITGQPRATHTLTASLADPDGGVKNQSWRWQHKSPVHIIPGANKAAYTPVTGDIGKTLIALVTYADNANGGNVAFAEVGPIKNATG